jgi:hypothetical protein
LSDADILLTFQKCVLGDLIRHQTELLGRRRAVRAEFGYSNSQFINVASPGHREYETLVRLSDLVKVAIARKRSDVPGTVTGAIGATSKTELGNTVPAKTGSSIKAGPIADRRSAVQAYIDEVGRIKGQRITRTDIWKRVGDKTRAEFERWEHGWYEKHGKKPNSAADRRFTGVLRDKPHLK